MKVSTIVDFHVVRKMGPWLTKSHARNYWGEGYMSIGIHPNQQKVPFANFVKSFKGMSEYDNE
jgi:hypothetical protein